MLFVVLDIHSKPHFRPLSSIYECLSPACLLVVCETLLHSCMAQDAPAGVRETVVCLTLQVTKP